MVYNFEEDESYLWNRKRAYKSPITLKDFEKILPRGKTLSDYTFEELQGMTHRLPIEKRVQQGVLWKKVLETKAGIANDQIEHIEESEKYREELRVTSFVGWSAYPGVRSYPKE